jgi:hypothetical protein
MSEKRHEVVGSPGTNAWAETQLTYLGAPAYHGTVS